MKRIFLFIFLFVFNTFIFFSIKNMIPLSYGERLINDRAVNYVLEKQEVEKLSPKDCAVYYINYKTDYHGKLSEEYIITQMEIENGFKVTIKNLNVRDDSVYATIDVVYLEYFEDKKLLKPMKHKWSHKGRGTWGWTSESTI